jgi:hypothetical protein
LEFIRMERVPAHEHTWLDAQDFAT